VKTGKADRPRKRKKKLQQTHFEDMITSHQHHQYQFNIRTFHDRIKNVFIQQQHLSSSSSFSHHDNQSRSSPLHQHQQHRTTFTIHHQKELQSFQEHSSQLFQAIVQLIIQRQNKEDGEEADQYNKNDNYYENDNSTTASTTSSIVIIEFTYMCKVLFDFMSLIINFSSSSSSLVSTFGNDDKDDHDESKRQQDKTTMILEIKLVGTLTPNDFQHRQQREDNSIIINDFLFEEFVKLISLLSLLRDYDLLSSSSSSSISNTDSRHNFDVTMNLLITAVFQVLNALLLVLSSSSSSSTTEKEMNDHQNYITSDNKVSSLNKTEILFEWMSSTLMSRIDHQVIINSEMSKEQQDETDENDSSEQEQVKLCSKILSALCFPVPSSSSCSSSLGRENYLRCRLLPHNQHQHESMSDVEMSERQRQRACTMLSRFRAVCEHFVEVMMMAEEDPQRQQRNPSDELLLDAVSWFLETTSSFSSKSPDTNTVAISPVALASNLREVGHHNHHDHPGVAQEDRSMHSASSPFSQSSFSHSPSPKPRSNNNRFHQQQLLFEEKEEDHDHQVVNNDKDHQFHASENENNSNDSNLVHCRSGELLQQLSSSSSSGLVRENAQHLERSMMTAAMRMTMDAAATAHAPNHQHQHQKQQQQSFEQMMKKIVAEQLIEILGVDERDDEKTRDVDEQDSSSFRTRLSPSTREAWEEFTSKKPTKQKGDWQQQKRGISSPSFVVGVNRSDQHDHHHHHSLFQSPEHCHIKQLHPRQGLVQQEQEQLRNSNSTSPPLLQPEVHPFFSGRSGNNNNNKSHQEARIGLLERQLRDLHEKYELEKEQWTRHSEEQQRQIREILNQRSQAHFGLGHLKF